VQGRKPHPQAKEGRNWPLEKECEVGSVRLGQWLWWQWEVIGAEPMSAGPLGLSTAHQVWGFCCSRLWSLGVRHHAGWLHGRRQHFFLYRWPLTYNGSTLDDVKSHPCRIAFHFQSINYRRHWTLWDKTGLVWEGFAQCRLVEVCWVCVGSARLSKEVLKVR
jgi:hypothetical protein